MNALPVLLRGVWLATLLIIGSVVFSSRSYSQSDSREPEVVLFVGHLNFDCFADTVVGRMDRRFRYLPSSVHWGRMKGAQTTDAPRIDTACLDRIPQNKRVPITLIIFPPWDSLSGSVSFQKMNPDTLTDLLITLRGRIGDSAHRRDTLLPLLLFGQHGLDTLPLLNLAEVGSFQTAPFFAMTLRFGTDLAEPEIRDLSGVVSFVINPIPFGVDRKEPERERGTGVAEQPIHVRVFPNPTGAAAEIAAESTPAGEYSVEVVAVNGQVYKRQEVSVGPSSGLFRVLDLHDIPSGYYLVRLHTATKLIGSYPIIITR